VHVVAVLAHDYHIDQLYSDEGAMFEPPDIVIREHFLPGDVNGYHHDLVTGVTFARTGCTACR
jgi:hypothetical protein